MVYPPTWWVHYLFLSPTPSPWAGVPPGGTPHFMWAPTHEVGGGPWRGSPLGVPGGTIHYLYPPPGINGVSPNIYSK